MQAPPSRNAPLPPGSAAGSSTASGPSGIESAVAELKAALARDPDGFTSDASAKAILDRLNAEIARVYGTEGLENGRGRRRDDDDEEDDEDEEDEDEDDEEDEDDYDDEDEDDEEDDEEGDGEDDEDERGSKEPRVELPKGPRPYDLWRAAHEIDRPNKQKVVLTGGEWNALVARLNESSRRKQGYLLRAQHQQIAAELAGLTFSPHISERSRELAAANKSLPQRVEALMRRKKAKLDRIRHDRVEAELKEATFRPNLSATANARAAKSVTESRRRVGHLLQYEMDKRLRASQRRQLVQEMESRDLTFNPAINKNSIRIVDRLNKERQAQLAMTAQSGGGGDYAPSSPGGTGEPIVPSSRVAAAKKALTAALAAGLSLPTAAQVTGLPVPDPKLLRSLGRSYLPGHEEETFHPKINPRSAALAAAAVAAATSSDSQSGASASSSNLLLPHNPAFADQSVYHRLYTAVTQARSTKLRKERAGSSKSPKNNKTAPLLGGAGAGAGADDDEASSSSLRRATTTTDAQGYPIDDQGEPMPGHPQHFNVVPFAPSSMDFILRRLVPSSSTTAMMMASASSSSSSSGLPPTLSALLQQQQGGQ